MTHSKRSAEDRAATKAQALRDLEATLIDDEARQRFYELISNPPEPSDALKKLVGADRFP